MQAATQGTSIAANASPQLVATPCPCDGLEMWCASTFTFTYTDPNNQNEQVGAGLVAKEISATDYEVRIDAPKGSPWAANTVVGVITGNATVYFNPRRSPVG